MESQDKMDTYSGQMAEITNIMLIHAQWVHGSMWGSYKKVKMTKMTAFEEIAFPYY
jgi:hypothetical protein